MNIGFLPTLLPLLNRNDQFDPIISYLLLSAGCLPCGINWLPAPTSTMLSPHFNRNDRTCFPLNFAALCRMSALWHQLTPPTNTMLSPPFNRNDQTFVCLDFAAYAGCLPCGIYNSFPTYFCAREWPYHRQVEQFSTCIQDPKGLSPQRSFFPWIFALHLNILWDC